jgi:hypothetical protein
MTDFREFPLSAVRFAPPGMSSWYLRPVGPTLVLQDEDAKNRPSEGPSLGESVYIRASFVHPWGICTSMGYLYI